MSYIWAHLPFHLYFHVIYDEWGFTSWTIWHENIHKWLFFISPFHDQKVPRRKRQNPCVEINPWTVFLHIQKQTLCWSSMSSHPWPAVLPTGHTQANGQFFLLVFLSLILLHTSTHTYTCVLVSPVLPWPVHTLRDHTETAIWRQVSNTCSNRSAMQPMYLTYSKKHQLLPRMSEYTPLHQPVAEIIPLQLLWLSK